VVSLDAVRRNEAWDQILSVRGAILQSIRKHMDNQEYGFRSCLLSDDATWHWEGSREQHSDGTSSIILLFDPSTTFWGLLRI